jgi:alpha-aminoadipic semialdehyde synthase
MIAGAREVFELLPHEWVAPGDLPGLLSSFDASRPSHVLYGTVVPEERLVERVKGGGYNRQEYREFPERYRPIFHSTVAPYVSVLVNGIYWVRRLPRRRLEGTKVR